MKTFRNLSIALKLAIGFGLTLTLTAVLAITAIRAASSLNEDGQNLAGKALPRAIAAAEMQGTARDLRIQTIRLALASSQEEVRAQIKKVEEERAAWDKAVQKYRKNAVAADDKKNLEKTLEQAQVQFNSVTAIHEAAKAGNFKKALEILDGDSRTQFRQGLAHSIDELLKWNTERAEALKITLDGTNRSARNGILIALSIAVIVSIVFAKIVVDTIRRPVAELSNRFESLESHCLTSLQEGIARMESGDLTYKVTSSTAQIADPSKDEIGQMSTVFNGMLSKTQATIDAYERMRENLSVLVSTIKDNAALVASTSLQLDQAASQTGIAASDIANTIQQVAVASDEAARSSGQIASGAEQLAKSATQASDAMEKLQTRVADVQEGSQLQSTATKEASETAVTVSRAVEQTVASMGRIQSQVSTSSQAVSELGEKGQQIGAIVQTIEDIAQQTNLLALNAAIEAARAGEQGKGFAVVADEVRKLAERSASATQEIATLIDSVRAGVDQAVSSMEASNQEVSQGASSSAEAGNAIKEIIEAVKSVSQIATQNAKSIEEMVSGARVVSDAITAAASVSEETAAGAEEMSASTEEVSASAQTVSAAVEEQTAQIEEVGASAQNLSRLAEDLNGIVAKFKVEERSSGHLKLAA